KRPLDADEDSKAALLPKGEMVEDARAELLRPAPADTPQPAPPTPVKVVDVRVVDTAPVPATGAAAMVPPPPVLSKSDQFRSDDSDPRRSNPEMLLAASPADSETAAVSVPAATPVSAPIAETGDERRWWTATWIGPLLMALGGFILLMSPTWLRLRAVVAERSWSAER